MEPTCTGVRTLALCGQKTEILEGKNIDHFPLFINQTNYKVIAMKAPNFSKGRNVTSQDTCLRNSGPLRALVIKETINTFCTKKALPATEMQFYCPWLLRQAA